MGMLNRGAVSLVALLFSVVSAEAAVPSVTLNEDCTVHVLNRNIQVQKNGDWAMPNVPSTMGKIRARATCTQNGVIHHGQTDYFTVVADASIDVGAITFLNPELVPKSIAYQSSSFLLTSGPNTTLNLQVTAKYADTTSKDITTDPGMNYLSSNPAIASVDPYGLVTAIANGNAVITARKDGRVALASIRVSFFGADTDGDGIPDEAEILLGLNPNDPIDAVEDQDADGLTALEEYNLGTDIFNADSDGDGIKDGVEVSGSNGFVTNPLLKDTDGDGLSDSLEIQVGSDPTNGASTNLTAALSGITVTPTNATIVFNTIDGEASRQLTVTGQLIDGSTIDLTATARGTSYATSDLNVASFGVTSGLVFAGQTGTATITVTNGTHQAMAYVLTKAFTPHVVSFLALPGVTKGTASKNNYAYLASGTSGVSVIDISNKVVPTLVNVVDTYGDASDVLIDGNYLYVANGANGLKVYDVANPPALPLVASLTVPGYSHDLAISNGYLLIAAGLEGLQVIDARVPSQPSVVGLLAGVGNVVAVDAQGNKVVVGVDAFVASVDVTNPANPIIMSRVNVGEVEDVKLSGNHAHVAVGTMGYVSVDVSSPSSLVLGAGVYLENTLGLAVAGNHVFVSGGRSSTYAWYNFGLPYINITDPQTPVFQGTIGNQPVAKYFNPVKGSSVSGSFLFVPSGRLNFPVKGLTIFQYAPLRDVANQLPSVTLTSPTQGAPLASGGNVTLKAAALDDVEIVSVSFYVNGTFMGAVASQPYEMTYQIPVTYTGGITLSAVAQDIGGNESRVDMPFQVVSNTAPTIGLIEPLLPASFAEGSTLRIAASAADQEGISQVDFLVNGMVVGSDTTAPYLYDYQIPYNYSVGGNIQVSARVVDTVGVTVLTLPVSVNITANSFPTAWISSVSRVKWATDLMIKIEVSALGRGVRVRPRVELYVNGLLVGTNTYSGFYPFPFYYTPLVSGPISVYARVYNQLGNFTDSPVQVYNVVSPPTPTDTSLSSIDLSRQSQDDIRLSHGSVIAAESRIILHAFSNLATTIEFYENGQLIGSSQPVNGNASFAYSPTTPGVVSFTARGVSLSGQAQISTPITLNVTPNQPATISIASPLNGTSIVEGTTSITLQALATDDYFIRPVWDRVKFYVNGLRVYSPITKSGTSYSINYAVPATAVIGQTMTITASVLEKFQGVYRTITSSPAVLTVAPDPMTSVSGRVVDRDGVAVSGALVTNSSNSQITKSATDGSFLLTGLLTGKGEISLKAKSLVGGYLLEGNSAAISPVSNGVINSGDITLDRLSVESEKLHGFKAIYSHKSLSFPTLDIYGNLHVISLNKTATRGEVVYSMSSPLGQTLISETVLGFWSGDLSRSLADSVSLQFDQRGKLNIVWDQIVWNPVKRGFDSEIWYTVIDPSLHPRDGTPAVPANITVLTPMMVSSNDGLKSISPSLALDSSGYANIVWLDDIVEPLLGGVGSIRFIKLNGLNGLPIISERALNSVLGNHYDSLKTVMDQQEKIHLVWQESSQTKYSMINAIDGAVMIAPSIIRNAQSKIRSRLAFGSGQLHIIQLWSRGGEYIRINPSLATQDGSGVALGQLETFSEALLSGNLNWHSNGNIFVDSSGMSHIVWKMDSDTFVYQQWNVDGVKTWDYPKNLGRSPYILAGQSVDGGMYLLYDAFLNRLTAIWGVLESPHTWGWQAGSFGIRTRSFQFAANASIRGNVVHQNGSPAFGSRVVVGSGFDSSVTSSNALGVYSTQNVSLFFGSDAHVSATNRNNAASFLGDKNLLLLPGDNMIVPDIILANTPPVKYETNLGYRTSINSLDKSIPIHLPEGFSFPFFGKEYHHLYLSSNGRIHFGYSDSRRSNGLSDFLLQPQIAPWMTDVGIEYNYGYIYINDSIPGEIVISWNGVPNYRSSNKDNNSFQIILRETGEIQLGYSLMDNWYEAASTGLSAGPSAPATILATDLSQANLIGGNQQVVYETFARNTFDIRYSMLNFIPNVEGGYDMKRTPMDRIPLLPND